MTRHGPRDHAQRCGGGGPRLCAGSAAVEFLLYALGMGLVVTVVTLCSAVFQSAAAARARSIVRFVQPASVVLLLIAGAYIIYYWLTLGGLLRVVLRS